MFFFKLPNILYSLKNQICKNKVELMDNLLTNQPPKYLQRVANKIFTMCTILTLLGFRILIVE